MLAPKLHVTLQKLTMELNTNMEVLLTLYVSLTVNIIYTTYVYCQKIYNLFLRALQKQVEKIAFGELFFILFRSQRVQMNFIFNDNVRILCLSCNIKKSNTLPNCLKIAEINVVLIVFNGIICDVSAYTVSCCRSTCIKYQKFFIWSMTLSLFDSFVSTQSHTIAG